MGDTLYLSGDIGLEPGNKVPKEAATEARLLMESFERRLAAAGMTFANVVKTTVYLTDLADFARMNESYAKRFPGSPPARSTVPVTALPKGAKVEIEVLAVDV